MTNLLRKLPILLLASACNMGATQPIVPEGAGPRVLFIGNSLTYARLFAERIRAVEAQPALYMVWPALDRFGDFDRASESYRLAADSVDGILFPAGEAWRAAWRRDASLPLYGSDQFHPSTLGTYLAALVIYARLSNRSAVGLPSELRLSNGTLQVPTDRDRLLQQAADEALANWGASAARR
jgi:hypothetical protein